MARAQELRVVDPVLTNLVRGYSNAEFVAMNLFPVVTVQKESGKVPTFGSESFLVFATERALRASSNKLPVEARSSVDFATTEHDAAYPIDYREAQEDIFDTQKYGAFRAEAAILLRHEKAAADLAKATGTYTHSNYTTLTGSNQWTHADSDPIATVETGKEKIRSLIAKYPNTMIIGAAAFKTLKAHTKILERIKYSQLGVVTVDLVKSVFDIKNIFVGGAVYKTDAGVITDIWGDSAVLAYIPDAAPDGGRSMYEPSFGYTLRKTGMPEVDKYDEDGGKIQNVRATDNFVVKVVGNDAGYLINDINA